MSYPENQKKSNDQYKSGNTNSWIISKNPETRLRELNNSLKEMGIYGPAKSCFVGRSK